MNKYGLLSLIRDLYDNSIISYKTGTEQTTNLVLDTIKLAKQKEAVATELQVTAIIGIHPNAVRLYGKALIFKSVFKKRK